MVTTHNREDIYARLHALAGRNPQAVRQFAVWCARQALVHTTDPRMTACVETTEHYLRGEATQAELDAARKAADAYAAWAAAAADAAAWAARAVWAAAKAAAWDARAADAAYAAYAAWAAAREAAHTAQLAKLSELDGE